jgi:hypothetical protein
MASVSTMWRDGGSAWGVDREFVSLEGLGKI